MIMEGLSGWEYDWVGLLTGGPPGIALSLECEEFQPSQGTNKLQRLSLSPLCVIDCSCVCVVCVCDILFLRVAVCDTL